MFSTLQKLLKFVNTQQRRMAMPLRIVS